MGYPKGNGFWGGVDQLGWDQPVYDTLEKLFKDDQGGLDVRQREDGDPVYGV